jgi:predicted nucleic acid-binding protein
MPIALVARLPPRLHTNILSDLRRPRPERKVLAFVASRPLELLHISIVTLAEIRFGIELVPDPARRSELIDWLTHKVRPMFEQRTIDVSEDVMFKWRHAGIRAGEERCEWCRLAVYDSHACLCVPKPSFNDHSSTIGCQLRVSVVSAHDIVSIGLAKSFWRRRVTNPGDC